MVTHDTYHYIIGNLDKAVDCGLQALKIIEEQFGPDDINVSGILLRLGNNNIFGGKILIYK